MTNADIPNALQSYVRDLERRLRECESDKERLVLWRESSRVMNAVALQLAGLAKIVAFTEIKPKQR